MSAPYLTWSQARVARERARAQSSLSPAPPLTHVPSGRILKSIQFDPTSEDEPIMTFPARHSTDRVAARTYTQHGAVLVTRTPSQRELVAWSLLRCPDERVRPERR
jgi:hypothetical protein